MELACIILAAAAIAALVFSVSVLKDGQRALKEIATEAILSSRAHSAEELALASAHAHQMRADREAGAEVMQPAPGAPPNDPDRVMLNDGTILNVLRPFG